MEEKQENKKMSTTKKLTGSAIFSALAFAISYLEFPIFPQAGFLKMDFALVIITLGAFIYGFVPSLIIAFVKELLCFLFKSSSGGIGELCNFTLAVVFITIPSLCYRYKKGLPFVILYFVISSTVYTGLAILLNRFVFLPLYGYEKYFSSIWQFILYFNLIKTSIISILTILLYKRLKNVIMRI